MTLFDASPKLYFGADALDYILSLPDEKTLVVTDPYMVSSGTVKEVTGRLERIGAPYTVFSDVEPDPSIETVAAGLQVIFKEKPNVIIALGGGSAIDATKAMLFFCVRVKASLMDERYVHHPRFIAIPTTSGTGSEVTSYAVITDRQNGVKIPLSHRNMIPDAAILDPEFTKTLPKPMIAFTGMDVLTHAVEAFVSPMANDFTNALAAEAASLTLRCLPAFFDDAGNAEMREKMYSASTMAGLAFTNAALGLCHGVAHTMGGAYHIPHGKANAVVLPYIIRFNSERSSKAAERYAELAARLGLGAGGNADRRERLLLTVKGLGVKFGIPANISECGVEKERFFADMEDNIDKILDDATTRANPVKVQRQDLRELLTEIYSG